jgi:hypothetical protein
MSRPRTRTIVGIGLSLMYLILVSFSISNAFDCPAVSYCLQLSLFYFSLPWIFLIVAILRLFGIPDVGTMAGYFLFGLSITVNAVILFLIPRLVAKFIYDVPEADTNLSGSE